MNSHPTTIRGLTGNPATEAMELADVRGCSALPDDANAEMDTAFGYGTPADELTEREIDAEYEREMERRDRENRTTFCGTSDDGGHDPEPGSGRLAVPPIIEASFGAYDDDALCVAVDCLDRGVVEKISEEQRQMLLFAATAEVLRRLDARQNRQAA
jgi:hypothetical protein